MLTLRDNKQSQDNNFYLLHKIGLEKKNVSVSYDTCIYYKTITHIK